MGKFKFRLETLLGVRRAAEDEAKAAYLEAMARRVAAEGDVDGIVQRRQTLLCHSQETLADRVTNERYLERLDDEQRAQESLVALLSDEEEQARQRWAMAHQEVEALVKLKDKAHAEWLYEEQRKEQGEMDEWASMRRAA